MKHLLDSIGFCWFGSISINISKNPVDKSQKKPINKKKKRIFSSLFNLVK